MKTTKLAALILTIAVALFILIPSLSWAGDDGATLFKTKCAACHGADGRGNQLLGAPNLTDQIWLNGGSVAAVRSSIAGGRHAEMPAHLERLGQTRVNLLAAYVISLGGAETTAVAGAAAQTPATTATAPATTSAVISP